MLEVDNVRAGYGAINVLWDVTLSFEKGRVTSIIGPNGAGKTTLLRAIMGLLPISRGTIRYEGTPLNETSTWRMATLGLAMIPEGRMVFRDMTIEENLLLGAFPREQRRKARANCEKAYAMFPRLAERRHQLAGTLSGGEAQMLAMGRGLMSDPRVLIVDEPSLGLAPVVVNELFDTL
jgi:branched-chain amino acid transport system ATP-binding protein